MLYEAIQLGCEIYHESETAYDGAYRRYRAHRNGEASAKWDNPILLDYGEAERVIAFANEWKSRMPSFPENVQRVLVGLKSAVPNLNMLQNATLLDVQFELIISNGMTVSELIANSFDAVAGASRRRDGTAVYVSVGTSKMLNAAVNPCLFVMWDGAIQSGYGVYGTGTQYSKFLMEMQKLARFSVAEAMNVEDMSYDEAIMSFTDRCRNRNSLAKILDEFNYSKFTLRDPRIRVKERAL